MEEPEPTESKAAQLVGAALKPSANRLDLAGVFGLVAPLAATLGLFKATGSIGRIQRDDPYLLWLAIALVLLAGTMLTNRQLPLRRRGEPGSQAVAKAMITATLSDDYSELTAHVTASNLKTDRRLAFKVDLATVNPKLTVAHRGTN